MRTHCALLMIILVLVGCGSAVNAPPNTGITGQVLVGPTCPVVQYGQPCPDKPVQATVQVLDPGGAKITEFQTDAQGRFTVSLAPGTYVLRPQRGDGQGLGNMGKDQPVTVTQGQYTTVQLTIDSGIR